MKCTWNQFRNQSLFCFSLSFQLITMNSFSQTWFISNPNRFWVRFFAIAFAVCLLLLFPNLLIILFLHLLNHDAIIFLRLFVIIRTEHSPLCLRLNYLINSINYWRLVRPQFVRLMLRIPSNRSTIKSNRCLKCTAKHSKATTGPIYGHLFLTFHPRSCLKRRASSLSAFGLCHVLNFNFLFL